MNSGAMIQQMGCGLLAAAVFSWSSGALASTPTAILTPHADSTGFAQVQLQIDKLWATNGPTSSYSIAKAQCWLNTARTQYAENDRTGYVAEALAESARIATALEGRPASAPGFETPLIARSNRLRDDLWAQLALLKNQPETLACAGPSVACAEVNLVRAGHADVQTGWRQANPYVEMAQDGLRSARAEAAACVQPLPPVPVVVMAPVVVPPVSPAAQPILRLDLSGDALFKFGQSSRAAMLPGGLKSLTELADQLRQAKVIEQISVTGHTDRLGSPAYNDRLSYDRAATVLSYLESLGIKAGNTQVRGVGKKDPVSNCPDSLARPALIQCLQPDRRVSIEVTGIR